MTKYHRITPSKPTMSKSGGRHIGLLLLCLCVLVDILQLIPQSIIGPILAIALLFTYFVLNETVLATVIIVFINDGLGTIVGRGIHDSGNMSLSFPYLLLIFIIWEVLFRKNISVKSALLFVLVSVICGQLSIVGDIAWRQTLFAILYSVSLIVQYFKYREQPGVFFDKLCTALALTMALISVHALITGGVEYYEVNEYSEEFLRKGIIGTGNGDSNFSGLFLCTGIIGALNSKSLHLIQKAILSCLIIASLTITLSVTAIFSLSIIIFLHFSIGKQVPKAIVILLVVLLVLILIYNIYVSLPADQRNNTIDAYIERVTTKVDDFLDGDYNIATTNRTNIGQRYLHYLFNIQSTAKLFFGGNPIAALGGAAHNTYIDWILQFGLLGLFVLSIFIIKRFICAYKLPIDTPYRRLLISGKVLYLVYALTLSIFDGATFAALFLFVFVL